MLPHSQEGIVGGQCRRIVGDIATVLHHVNENDSGGTT
jgi:hypothetical protein